jgi:fumarate reductase flavoprotein subunit
MGGIDTDVHGATSLGGLYAAGEAACVSINGANRLGSNSLTECLVFGARAGRSASAFAAGHGVSEAGAASQLADELERLRRDYLGKSGGSESVAGIRSEMQKTMEGSAGIYRTGASLEQAAAALQSLRERYGGIRIEDRSHTFNTQLTAALELGYMLDISEAIVQSALQRRESRGAHQRTDFPARDDQNYLRHSKAYRRPDGPPKIEYSPVSITRWPPGERVYGR